MATISSTGFKVEDNVLWLLDQTKLPTKECWDAYERAEKLVEAIRALKVRGAPAIGICAALFALTELKRGADARTLLALTDLLRSSRPTAVNLMNYMDTLDAVLREEHQDWKFQFEQRVESIYFDDIELCERIAKAGLPLLPKNAKVLTHCNTGSIATAGRGTALGILTKAHESGNGIHVWVDETRPLLQGARLTTWELAQANVPHTLICDNMAATLMASGEVDAVLVGADRVAKNGDFANKIGTYSLAVLAKHHGVPFYIAAPETTLDLKCDSGKEIPIEQRPADEVRRDFSPKDTPVFNPAFDVTPAELVTAWIFDTGVRRSMVG